MSTSRDFLGGMVIFVGAGPGDPELLTLRGKRVIERADLVIYADSLVHPGIGDFARPGAVVIGSSSLSLEEVGERMIAAARAGQLVARVQSGDPAVYGAVHEQMVLLDAAGVEYAIVPGVSSAFAAAAVLRAELTVPEVAQSVVLTRTSGRASPMPETERLATFAQSGATLAIHLSINNLARIVRELTPILGADCPAAVAYRVGWPDERLIRATLGTIRGRVRGQGITRTALILVGRALAGDDFEDSRLYAADHHHVLRPANVARGDA